MSSSKYIVTQMSLTMIKSCPSNCGEDFFYYFLLLRKEDMEHAYERNKD